MQCCSIIVGEVENLKWVFVCEVCRRSKFCVWYLFCAREEGVLFIEVGALPRAEGSDSLEAT